MNRSFALAVAAAVLAAACTATPPAPAEPAAPAEPITPTLELAAQATYAGIWDDLAITLADGAFEQAEEFRRAVLLDEVAGRGDLDGDGIEDLVVLVAENSGGSGSFVYLSALRAADAGRPLKAALVGDRVQIRSVAVAEERIVLSVVQAGDDDAMCCPGELALRSWQVVDNSLQEQPMETQGRLSLATVAGNWTLVEWEAGEPAELERPITLTIDGDRFAGDSGCNRYTATGSEGDAPGDLTIGPVAGTRKMCPGPLMEAETRYLEALQGVFKFGFLNGRLALTTRVGEEYGTLLFAPAEPE